MVETKGEHGYLGFSIGAREGGLVVASVDRDGPAWEAGLRRGDRLVRVDGKDASALDKKAAAALLRKEAGSAVTLEVTRAGETGSVALRMVCAPRAPTPRLSVKALVSGLALVAAIAVVVVLAVSGTAGHRRVAEAYVTHLQQGDARAAFDLFAPERRRVLSFESWQASSATTSLLGSRDVSFGQSSAISDGRGCVSGSVATDGGRYHFAVYTQLDDDGAWIHSVLGNEEQRGWFDQGPWRCW